MSPGARTLGTGQFLLAQGSHWLLCKGQEDSVCGCSYHYRQGRAGLANASQKHMSLKEKVHKSDHRETRRCHLTSGSMVTIKKKRKKEKE